MNYQIITVFLQKGFKIEMIMKLSDYSNITSTPVWNEVKNWSDDDKNELITLLYTTMDKVNPYVVPLLYDSLILNGKWYYHYHDPLMPSPH